MKIKKLIIPIVILNFGCEHIEKINVNGEITGTKYSAQPFVKNKHVLSATYPLSERVNIKGKVAQTYISNHAIDNNTPDYGETGLEILF